MKKIIALSLSLFGLSNAFAAPLGFYVGAAVGYGLLNTPDQVFDARGPGSSSSNNSGGVAGRGFIGLNFNPYLGIEGGYAVYPNSKYEASDFFGSSSLKYTANIADAELKAYLPLFHQRANIYVLAGAARVLQKVTFDDGGVPLDIAEPNPGTTNVYKTRPLYGVGATYNINCNLSVRAEGTKIQNLDGFATARNAVPNIYLASAGLAYNFG